jgi:type IV pilus assembly protein PilY1
MEMDALTGGRLQETPFDNNNDGEFNDQDFIQITDEDGNQVWVPVSGTESTVGPAQSAGVLDGEKLELKYLSGANADASGGNLQRIVENPGVDAEGRQSWRQIK